MGRIWDLLDQANDQTLVLMLLLLPLLRREPDRDSAIIIKKGNKNIKAGLVEGQDYNPWHVPARSC